MGSSSPLCQSLPPLVSSFIDAFVDYTVSGFFLPTPDSESSTGNGHHRRVSQEPPTRLHAPSRVVAIGDLHGDVDKARKALSIAGVLDPSNDSWVGGNTVAVQVGDLLDRGDDEIKLLYLLQRLKSQAARSGGALVTLHGNHEIMNMEMDFRYATRKGLNEFEIWGWWYRTGIAMKTLCRGLQKPEDPFVGVPKRFQGVRPAVWKALRARTAALGPNGPLRRRFLEGNQAVVMVDDSVFVHAGLLEMHVKHGLERINDEVREWVRRPGGHRPPWYLRDDRKYLEYSVVWMRRFSSGLNCDCGGIKKVLNEISKDTTVARMVMGHSVHRKGINSVCGDLAVRIDVGMSRWYGGKPEVLEISGGLLKTLPVGSKFWRYP